jgi:hypothetical protein
MEEEARYKTGTYGKDEEDVRKRLKDRQKRHPKRKKDQKTEWMSSGMEKHRTS